MLRRFIVGGAQAIGCDVSFVALPCLAVLAAAIGTSRKLVAKRGWYVPSAIWPVVIGESGTAKTPAFKLALKPLRERQKRLLDQYHAALREHESAVEVFEKERADWKKKTNCGPPPERPVAPAPVRVLIGDTTIEAVAPIAQANVRGFLVARDELSGWIGSFDRYSSGKGSSDASKWLEFYNGEALIIDRKTGTGTLYVPQVLASLTGGIQPEILRKALSTEHRESGLAARLLLAFPPRRVKQWTEAEIAPEVESLYAFIIDRLYELEPTTTEEGELRSVLVNLDAEAKALFVDYFNTHAQEQAELSGDLAAAWSKLEETALRLSLVIHFTRWASRDSSLIDEGTVDAATMKAAIELTAWFKNEAKRIYSMLHETEKDTEERRLIEWIERRGGEVSIREVQQGHRSCKTAEDAELILSDLVKSGAGAWLPIPPSTKGGRATRKFRLSQAVYVYTTPLFQVENDSCVDRDTSILHPGRTIAFDEFNERGAQ